MKTFSMARVALFALATGMGLVLTGCGNADKQGVVEPTDGVKPAAAADIAQRDWCPEHGVPESECGQCNAKLAAEFQKKGDWYKEHNRPESQCFVCNPKAAEKFAAVYEAKFGEKPPKPTE